MSRPERLKSVEATLDNPNNYVRVGRTPGSAWAPKGFLLTECVDRRLVHRGGLIRVPGNSLATATTMMMRGEARNMREGLVHASRFLRPGAHRQNCAYDQNLQGVVGLIANQDPRVLSLYDYLGDSVNAALPRDRRVANDGWVVDRAQATEELLRDHRPDELIDFTDRLLAGEVIDPGTPDVQDPSVYVIDTDPSDQVLRHGAVASGEHYLDSHVKANALEGGLPDDFRPDMLALTAATAVLVATRFKLPILVAEGAPGRRDYVTQII